MQADLQKRSAPTGQGRGAGTSQGNVLKLHAQRNSDFDIAKVLDYLRLATALVECAASILIAGQRVSVAGRDVLLQVALRLREIGESLR
jgi:hypothetical protein